MDNAGYVFTSLLNAKQISSGFLESLCENSEVIKSALKGMSRVPAIRALSEIRRDLEQNLRAAKADLGRADDLASWISDVLAPRMEFDEKSRLVVETQDRDSIERLCDALEFEIADEMFNLLTSKSLEYIKECPECGSFFVATRISRTYCGEKCKRKKDLRLHGDSYYRKLKARRSGMDYLPKYFFHCRKCKKRISVTIPETKRINKVVRQFRCKCGNIEDNPHYVEPK